MCPMGIPEEENRKDERQVMLEGMVPEKFKT